MATERQKEIKRRRHRRHKIQKLRARLEKATSPRERAFLIKKIKAASPYAPVPDR